MHFVEEHATGRPDNIHMGDHKSKISHNKVDGHIQNFLPAISNRKMVIFKTSYLRFQIAIPIHDCESISGKIIL